MPTRRARFRRKFYARLPKWLKNHDFEVFAAILSILGGLPILLGRVDPNSPEKLLPPLLVNTWAAVLVLAGVLVLTGVIVGSRHYFPEKVFWMRMEALGLTALAYFCYLYAGCIFLAAIRVGWIPALITMAFGVVSHVREAAIQIEIEAYRKTLGLKERI